MRRFSLSGYRSLLQSLTDAGYASVDLGEVSEGGRRVFLRHDVDFCPLYCLPIARAEAQANVASTFYFLTSSPFYNVLEPSTKEAIRAIRSLGHAIGLHFDVTAYGGVAADAEPFARQEMALLADVAGGTVASLSFHRPAPDLIGRDSSFAGCPHTYQPQFIQQTAYYSDSQGAWRFGHPLDSEAFRNGTAIHLLTHPIWWCFDDEEPPTSRIERWLSDNLARQIREAARNCKSFDPSGISAVSVKEGMISP